MIMTLASVLSNKTSGINKNKSVKGLETVGEGVIDDLKSSNHSKSGIEKTVLSNNENIINNKNPDNGSKKLSNKAIHGILVASGVVTTGLGALAYHVAGLLFGNRSTKPTVNPIFDKIERGKNVAIDYYSKMGVTNINIGMGLRFNKAGEGIEFNPSKAVQLLNPNVSSDEFLTAAVDSSECYFTFFWSYQQFLINEVNLIALKHNIILPSIDANGNVVGDGEYNKKYQKVEIHVSVIYEGNKLLVKIFNYDNKDITQEYNKDNPETDLDKRKKEFYDELVKFINNDDFIKKLFLE